LTSSQLPAARPSGVSMFVSSARVLTPHSALSVTSARASARAFSRVGMNAAAPNFTSSTSAPSPSASFLDRMDATISGMDGTVAVASRSAYSSLSAGTMRSVWPPMTHPTRCTSSTMRPAGGRL